MWQSTHYTRYILVEGGVKNHTTARFRNIAGPQIRKFREYRGWSQATLAAKCQVEGWDITRDVVATIENRVRWIGDFELVLLARILGVPLIDLLPDRVNWGEMNSAMR